MKSRKPRSDKPGACLLLLLVLLGLGAAGAHEPGAEIPRTGEAGACWVEVRGSVEAPGVYAFSGPPPLKAVLSRAGLEGAGTRRLVPPGTRIRVTERHGEIVLSSEPMSAYSCMTLGLKIPLNRVPRDELPALPGVGPVLAEAIAETRTELGGFKQVEELRTVRGIGPKLLQGIRPHIRLP